LLANRGISIEAEALSKREARSRLLNSKSEGPTGPAESIQPSNSKLQCVIAALSGKIASAAAKRFCHQIGTTKYEEVTTLEIAQFQDFASEISKHRSVRRHKQRKSSNLLKH
jgi:hypothetical protein